MCEPGTMEAAQRGRKSHNEMGNLQNIYLQKRGGEWLNKGLTPPRTPLAPPKGLFRPPAAQPPAPGVRAGSAVCLPIHIPIHIPIHSPAGPGSPQHPPTGAAERSRERAPSRRARGIPGLPPRAGVPGPCRSFVSDGAFPHFEPRRRARVPSDRSASPSQRSK
ncbi:splicing factor, proline- and glutamine-rich-like [Poecile atricapillus]|uniref:splicing factor, proline- and glutamine-rich-like n=1 Tax=Poecile atricapillus TaxID=48891 RepID=UPI00273897F7|nr:splicing factor, proline- and glutamine-rich-like [Poecile atricapillus]